MVAQSVMLDDLRRQSGAQLLRMTDEFGFGALGAAWVHDAEASRWWYLLVSPMIDTKGPRWVYDRLIRIFQKLALPEGITPLDIRIASPHEQDWRTIAASMHVDDSEIEIRSSEIGGVRIDRMLAYRILHADNLHRRRERVFDTRYRELMRAA
jgi:hypothetical protein